MRRCILQGLLKNRNVHPNPLGNSTFSQLRNKRQLVLVGAPTQDLRDYFRVRAQSIGTRGLTTRAAATPPSYYDSLFADQIGQENFQSETTTSPTRQELMNFARLRREKDIGLIDKTISNKVLGVILEDATNKLAGTTVVAAYYDGTAAFYNGKQYHNASSQDDEYLDKLITNFFHFAGERKNDINILVKDGERGGPPDNGIIRISYLTPGGILKGEFKQFNQVFEVVTAATDLGLYLIMNS